MKIESALYALGETETMLTSLKGDVNNMLDYAVEHIREAKKDLENNAQIGESIRAFGKIGVVCHHSASRTDSVESIRRYHIEERGWDDIGYHIIIDRDGKLVIGRNWESQGCHGQNDFNKHYLGLCVLGNFEEDTMRESQLACLLRVVAGLSRLFLWDSSHWIAHRDVKDTLCPGKNFPMAEVKKMADANAKEFLI